MDEISAYNRERWNALAQARCAYTQPLLDLDETSAREWLAQKPAFAQPYVADLTGKDVFCLASGGGQQTAVFAVMGATVTVLDLSDIQLERDREAAAHYGHFITTIQGDMRHLAPLSSDSFDLVWQPYSINFVPDPRPVLTEVARVLRPGGYYHLDFANPFWTMEETDWTGTGYPIGKPYVQGLETNLDSPNWDIELETGEMQQIAGPREFTHTFSTLINGLVAVGFSIQGFAEGPAPTDPHAPPGSWDHLVTVLPPFLTIGAVYRPNGR